MSRAGPEVSFALGRQAATGSQARNDDDASGAQLAVSVNGRIFATITGGNTGLLSAAGLGSKTLSLSISEDAWKNNTQLTVSVDGQQISKALTTVRASPSLTQLCRREFT